MMWGGSSCAIGLSHPGICYDEVENEDEER